MTAHTSRMPFGAEVLDDGSVRFRLWAPAAVRVDLCPGFGGQERLLEMKAGADGWLERVTREARPGELYRYRINGDQEVPDPASRYPPRDVHGPSQVVDPAIFAWEDDTWQGRPWDEAVFCELHVGTFSPEGTFRGVAERLDYLSDLGITAIELMPVADFPGERNWGYDGVLPFAPAATYGGPADLKALVQAAHRKGLMVFLDVVYNHFGPEGNYLHLSAPTFFTGRHQTPWGDGINFDGEGSRVVRDFFIHNALYWLEEYRFDGLRLDAVHAIAGDSKPDILVELAEAVTNGPGRKRQIHLVLENDHNAAHYLERRADRAPRWYAAQWNDDFHHAAHLLATGESDGYYLDYRDRPAVKLAHCLVEGFAYQGDPSRLRGGVSRVLRSKIDWGASSQTRHADWYQLHRDFLAVRRREIAPRLAGMIRGAGFEHMGERCFRVSWRPGDGAQLTLTANLGDTEHPIAPPLREVPRSPLYSEPDSAGRVLDEGRMLSWSVVWRA